LLCARYTAHALRGEKPLGYDKTPNGQLGLGPARGAAASFEFTCGRAAMSGAVAALALLARRGGNQFEFADVGNPTFKCCDARLKALKLLHLARDHDTGHSKQSNPYQADHQLS